MPIDGYFDTPFAAGGDVSPIPDALDPSGNVSYEQGYPIGYQLPVGNAGRKTIERNKFNQLMNSVTSALQQYQQKGVPPFITTTMNGGSPFSYKQGDRVVLSDVIYTSLVDSNTTTPPSSSWGGGFTAILSLVYPVGSYYFNETNPANPATYFGFGTWIAVADTFVVGHGVTYTGTGGSPTATLTEENNARHAHLMYPDTTAGSTVFAFNTFTHTASNAPAGGTTGGIQGCGTDTSGSGEPFSIIPPYQAAYIWKRTA